MVRVDEDKLSARLELGIQGMVRLGDLGLTGCADLSFSRYGVLVEIMEEIEVGSGYDSEVKVTDRNRVVYGVDEREEYYLRQFIGKEEAAMFEMACDGDTDFCFAAVRHTWRKTEIDDYIRWSLKKMCEEISFGTVYVWVWTVRHKIGTGKGLVREEVILLLLSSAGGGIEMGRSIFKCSGKGGNWGISVDNIGLELFTGFEHVKDTIFKGVRGTQKWVLEVDGCPGRFKHSDVLNLVGTKGISQVSCVIRRNIRTLGEKESRWYVIPMLGESVPDRGVIVKGNIRGLEWTMASSNRDGLDATDVDKMVAADLVWLAGKIDKMELGPRAKHEVEEELLGG